MSYNKKYLTRRPFLCIDKSITPKPRVGTHRKDWGNDPDAWDYHEIPYIVRRVSDKTIRRATIIIDLLENKLVKSRHAQTDNATPETVVEHFRRKYSQMISQALDFAEARSLINS